MSLDGLELIQAPVQFFHSLDGQFHVGVICKHDQQTLNWHIEYSLQVIDSDMLKTFVAVGFMLTEVKYLVGIYMPER
jgi:hypothetical protein